MSRTGKPYSNNQGPMFESDGTIFRISSLDVRDLQYMIHIPKSAILLLLPQSQRNAGLGFSGFRGQEKTNAKHEETA